MNLQTRKKTFLEDFQKIQNEEIVIRLEKLLRRELDKTKKTKQNFVPMSLEVFNERINISLLDSINGKLTEDKDLEIEIQSWK